MNVFCAVCSLCGTLFCLYFAYIAFFGGLRAARPVPAAAPKRRLAVVVPARNEAGVVGRLVESLRAQDYPRELYDIYVVPNNCTDDTEDAARAAGAKILSCTVEVHAKGDVLRFAFEALKDEGYDAYIILDADNLADPGFLRAANDMRQAGYRVAQGYRDSKNPGDGWVAGCTSVFYWFMNRLYNRARANLGLSAALNGTGILVAADVIAAYGWTANSLTEDLQFTAQCALYGIKIGWMEKAVTYDEQPRGMKDSFTQRRRWTAGTMQCCRRYLGPLMKKALLKRSGDCLDIAILFLGPVVQLLSVPPFALMCASAVRFLRANPDWQIFVLPALLGALALGVAAAGLFVVLICKLEGKKIRPAVFLTMFVYLATWIPANLLCFFTKAPKWKYIPHVSRKSIGEAQSLDQ